MSRIVTWLTRILPHPAVSGAILAAIMFGSARLVHRSFEHGQSGLEIEILSQVGIAVFCGGLLYILLTAVLRSVRFYEILARNTRDILLVLDGHGMIVEANRAAVDAYGYSREQLIGLDARRLAASETECPLEEALSSGETLLAEAAHVREDGSRFPVEVSLSPVSHSGRLSILVVARDISERKRKEMFGSIVHQVDRLILEGEPLDATLRFVCEEVAAGYGCSLVQVGLKGHDGDVEIREFAGEASNFLSSIKVRWDDTPEGRGPTGTAIRTGEVQVRDIETDPNFLPWRKSAREFGLTTSVAFPLAVGGNVVGALTLFRSNGADSWRETDELREFVEQLAPSVVAQMEKEKADLQSKALEAVANGVVLTDAWGVILWVNRAFERLTGYTRDEVIGKTPRILKSGKHAPSFYKSMWKTLSDGRVWRGEVYNRRKDGSIYVEEQTITPILRKDGEVSQFVAIKQDVTEQKEQQERITFLAAHDPLTELPNRRSFDAYIDRAVDQAVRGRNAVLLLANIDNFTLVNDTLGHHAGDQMLRQFALVLRRSFRPSDPIARFGGDEFAVLLEGATIERAGLAATRAGRAATTSGTHSGWEIPGVGVSFGIAEIDGSVDADGVIARADAAVRAAKVAGKGRVVCYSRDIETMHGIVELGPLAMRIKRALDDGRFVLVFQPVVCLACEGAQHFEALVRMIDEDGSVVPPDRFIPTAERVGLIREVDHWVIEHAIQRLKEKPELRIFVNISGSSLTDDELLASVKARIERASLVPGQLTFEITEATAVTDFASAQQWIHTLGQLGCRFALDDFGVGFSSLAYLRALPVDYVKIDRSFVSDVSTNPTNRAIIEAVRGVAKTLGREVIAEGVETTAHVETLRSLGVDRGQGFHWGRPMNEEHFLSIVGNGRAASGLALGGPAPQSCTCGMEAPILALGQAVRPTKVSSRA